MNQLAFSSSWKEQEEGTGLGFVLLEDSRIRLIGARRWNKTSSPLHAEAEGLSWAMKETRKLGASEVHFESDCQQLVRLIQEPQEWPALGAELDDIDFLSSEFDSFSISFIRRSENIRADYLSKAGRSRDSDFCFIGDTVPPWLAHEASFLETIA